MHQHHIGYGIGRTFKDRDRQSRVVERLNQAHLIRAITRCEGIFFGPFACGRPRWRCDGRRADHRFASVDRECRIGSGPWRTCRNAFDAERMGRQ